MSSLVFGLDFDDTFTADPELWALFIREAQAKGHRVYCDPTPGLESSVKDEIVRLRDQANKCVGLVLDASKREAHRICTTGDKS